MCVSLGKGVLDMSRLTGLCLGLLALVLAAVTGCMPTQTAKPASAEELQVKRDSAQISYSIAASYYQQGNYDAAVLNAEKSLAYDSTYFDPYILLGNVWRKRRDAAQAEGVFRKAIAVDPKQAKGYEALGDLFLEMGRYDDAVSVYVEGLRRDSSLVDLYNGVVDVYIRQGKTAQADSVFKEAMGRFPEDAVLQRMWAEFLQKQGRHQEAIGVLVPLTGRFPQLALLREKLARSYIEVKDYTKALAQLDTLLTIEPNSDQAVLTYGVILGRQGKFAQAMQKFDLVIAKDTTKALPYLYKGEAQLEQGSFGPAEATLRKALALDPALLQAWLDLGDVRSRQATANRGTNLASTSTPKLERAKEQYQEAKSFYARAMADPALASYARAQTEFCERNIQLVERELFVR
jgi:tetratricopeptide (TPR) repeat protein